MADIFISYAREDRSRIEPLAKSLEGLGWTVFWDRTIPAGKTWRQVIGEALKTARTIIVAWSHISVESDWVQEEADRGRKRNILIPVLLDNVDPPLGFGTIQAADLVNWDPAQSSPEFEKLIADIAVILGPSPRQIKEAEQAAEEERKRKQEEESKRKEEEVAEPHTDLTAAAKQDTARRPVKKEKDRLRSAKAKQEASVPEAKVTGPPQEEVVKTATEAREEDRTSAPLSRKGKWVVVGGIALFAITLLVWLSSGPEPEQTPGPSSTSYSTQTAAPPAPSVPVKPTPEACQDA